MEFTKKMKNKIILDSLLHKINKIVSLYLVTVLWFAVLLYYTIPNTMK